MKSFKKSLFQTKFYSIGFILFLLPFIALAVKVPSGSKLTISFKYKDNDGCTKYPNCINPNMYPEDFYGETIWIEGPYDPNKPCQIIDFERQNVKLSKIITFWGFGTYQNGRIIKYGFSSWNWPDYNTPDLYAAVITAGMYRYCLGGYNEASLGGDGLCKTTPLLAPINAQRQNPVTGGLFCGSNSVVCRILFPPKTSLPWRYHCFG